MSDIETLKNYFLKLQKVVNFEAEFSFFGKKVIKKNKIDDLLVCIQATIPEAYKDFMKTSRGRGMASVIGYNNLFKAVKGKFILSQEMYLVDVASAMQGIKSILTSIEKDINFAETNAG